MRELLFLIDTLEDTVEDARSEPLTGQARVDRMEIRAIIDHMGRAIPEEVKQARWIAMKRDEMLAEAKREAERILGEARQESARLLAVEEITKQAEGRASKIIEKARGPEREIRLGADGYADEILKAVETYLERFAAAAQRGPIHFRARARTQSLTRSLDAVP